MSPSSCCRMTLTVSTLALLTVVSMIRCGRSVSINGTTTLSKSAMIMRPAQSLSLATWNDNNTIERVDVCVLNACEAYVRMRDDLANVVRPINEKLHRSEADGGGGNRGAQLEARLQRLDRRLRSVEQPGIYKTFRN